MVRVQARRFARLVLRSADAAHHRAAGRFRHGAAQGGAPPINSQPEPSTRAAASRPALRTRSFRCEVFVTCAGALWRRAVAHPVLLRPPVCGPAPPAPVPPPRGLHLLTRLDAIALPPRGRRRLRTTPSVESHACVKAWPRPPDAAASRARVRGQPAEAAARQRCRLSLRRHCVCQAKGRADGPSRRLNTAPAGDAPSPRPGHAPSAACSCLYS